MIQDKKNISLPITRQFNINPIWNKFHYFETETLLANMITLCFWEISMLRVRIHYLIIFVMLRIYFAFLKNQHVLRRQFNINSISSIRNNFHYFETEASKHLDMSLIFKAKIDGSVPYTQFY